MQLSTVPGFSIRLAEKIDERRRNIALFLPIRVILHFTAPNALGRMSVWAEITLTQQILEALGKVPRDEIQLRFAEVFAEPVSNLKAIDDGGFSALIKYGVGRVLQATPIVSILTPQSAMNLTDYVSIRRFIDTLRNAKTPADIDLAVQHLGSAKQKVLVPRLLMNLVSKEMIFRRVTFYSGAKGKAPGYIKDRFC